MKVRMRARVQTGQRAPLICRAQRCTALCLADGLGEAFPLASQGLAQTAM